MYNITSGKCNSAIEVRLAPILEHYNVLYSRLFDNIASDPNHKLKVLLPPDHDNSSYNLRRLHLFNMPKLCTNRTSNTFIYAMSNSPGCGFIPLIFILYSLTYFNMNMLYRIFWYYLKNQFSIYFLEFIGNFQVL